VLVAATAVSVTACGGAGSSGNKNVLKVAYGSDFVFLTPALAKEWWTTVAHEFEQQHPGVKVEYTPIPGGYNDIVTKMNLLFRSPSTAPDVAELPWGQMGSWISSGYLLPMDKYVSSATWWQNFPESVKQETMSGGHVYGVNHGENDTAIYYNVPMFHKAGLPVPWNPKNWNDILAAAEKIKAAIPGVWPVWLQGGEAGGTISLQYNGANLIAGSSNPTIFDPKSQKWVVDSSGLREALGFYSELAKNGLQAPAAELLNPNAVVNSMAFGAKQKMAIAISGNFFGSAWAKGTCSPCWPQGNETYATTAMPTVNGTGATDVASALGGWELSIGAQASSPDLGWDFIQIAQQRENMIVASNTAAWVPPDRRLWNDKQFTAFAPPYNEYFAKLLPAATLAPNTSDYTVWGNGFNTASGQIIQNPSTTVDQAINTLKTYVTQQLGQNKVTTLP
jgi:multiple sugar transport system substrate-binding protein